MCLLIHKPAKKKIEDSRFENAFKNNEDGIGVAYVCPEAKDLVVHKGFMKLPEFLSFYKEKNLEALDCMIHFRAASPGMVVSKEMCHPFMIASGRYFTLDNSEDAKFVFAVGHNGKLPWRDTKKESDTALFVKEAIIPIVERDPFFFDYTETTMLMEKFVADSNKLCIYRFNRETKKLNVSFVNEKGGTGMRQAHWDSGCWYSNDSYKSAWAEVMNPVTVNYTHHYENSVWDHSNYRPTFDSRLGNFATADATGWKWDFTKHLWVNMFTKTEAKTLVSRPLPFYMRKYCTFSEKKPQSQQEKQLVVLEGGVRDSQPNQSSDSKPSKKGNAKQDSTYLTEQEIRMLRRFCYMHMKLFTANGKDKNKKTMVENMKLKEMMPFVRGELKHHIPARFSGLSEQEIDILVVGHIKNGCQTIDDIIIDELRSDN